MPLFLVISGQVPSNKRKELEHTFRIGISGLSQECISNSLSMDTQGLGFYYFFSVWTSEESMNGFIKSPEYQLLSGAFHALGSVRQVMNGQVNQII